MVANLTPGPTALPNFEVVGDCAHFRPVGATSPVLLLTTLKSAMEACQAAGLKKILINTHGLSGPDFTNFERLETSLKIFSFWDRSIKLAFVYPAIPGEFATALAYQQGLSVNLFNDEAPALVWLG